MLRDERDRRIVGGQGAVEHRADAHDCGEREQGRHGDPARPGVRAIHGHVPRRSRGWSPTLDATRGGAVRRTWRHATTRSARPMAWAVRRQSRVAASRQLDRVTTSWSVRPPRARSLAASATETSSSPRSGGRWSGIRTRGCVYDVVRDLALLDVPFDLRLVVGVIAECVEKGVQGSAGGPAGAFPGGRTLARARPARQGPELWRPELWVRPVSAGRRADRDGGGWTPIGT